MDNAVEYQKYRKERIAKLKKIIVFAVVLMIILPTVLCIILFLKLHGMQKQLDGVSQLFIMQIINHMGGYF